LSKESISESESDLDLSSQQTPKSILFKQIDNLIKRLHNDESVIDLVDTRIFEISNNLGLSLKQNVFLQKKQQVSSKTDKAYAEKYRKIIEVQKEIERCEENIKFNYHYVDSILIPHLKKLGNDLKMSKRKHKKAKKIFNEHANYFKELKSRSKKLELQIRMKVQSKRMSVGSLQNEHYQIDPEDNHYFKDSSSSDLNHLRNEHKKAFEAYSSVIEEIERCDDKIRLLENFKEQNEIDLRQSVDGLKFELKAVREELKTLEKEKVTISSKLKGIEYKYNEAKESFKNAEDVLTHTNRMIVDNHNNSLRASVGSEWSKYLKSHGSRLQCDSSHKLESDSSNLQMRNINSKQGTNFYDASKSYKNKLKEEDDESTEIYKK